MEGRDGQGKFDGVKGKSCEAYRNAKTEGKEGRDLPSLKERKRREERI